MKYAPSIRISPRHRGRYTVDYLDGFWLDLAMPYLLHFGQAAKMVRRWLATPLFIISIVLFVLFTLTPRMGGSIKADPILASATLTHHVYPLEMPALQPAETLQTTLHPLKPFGTYNNAYAALNCTWGVASRLPVPSDWGNANTWAFSAAAAGITVSGIPKVGAIAQTAGDSWLGHVAIVTAVNTDGSIVIWEENGEFGLGTTDERTTTTNEFPNFIYY